MGFVGSGTTARTTCAAENLHTLCCLTEVEGIKKQLINELAYLSRISVSTKWRDSECSGWLSVAFSLTTDASAPDGPSPPTTKH